jgi:hypothetical protein
MGLSYLLKPNVEKMKAKNDYIGLIKFLKHKDKNIQMALDALEINLMSNDAWNNKEITLERL